jgi:seryl-tRNA synthetase
MHDIKAIRDDAAAFDAGLKRRGLEPLSSSLLALDETRRAVVTKLQAAQERRNAASKEIGQAKAAKDEARAQALMAEVAALKADLQTGEDEERALDKALFDALAVIPNLPAPEVPDGPDDTGNVERHRVGTPRAFNYAPKQHFELGEGLGLMDFETATKISGARFVVLKGALARMERALAQFMLDIHTNEHGYTETNPPLLVRRETAFGTGNLPKFEDDLFKTIKSADITDLQPIMASVSRKFIEAKKLSRSSLTDEDRAQFRTQVFEAVHDYLGQDLKLGERDPHELIDVPLPLYLTPTAEVSMTNYVREQILDEAALPLRYTAWTPCFRSEAGSAGRDTRGMIRMHQFMKVELVSITTPEQSEHEHERMLTAAETVLRRLDLPYRTITLCSGDMGFSSRKTYDIEVWLPGQNAYREISSCSNCGDFQARRMNARYRPAEGKGTRFVHTLNGSGVAVGRCLVAVLENYQDADGSIAIPAALQPYMGGMTRIERP